MNEVKTKCASSRRGRPKGAWNSMDWDKLQAVVRKLQARIVKAQKEKRYNKVKALQRILTTSLLRKRWQSNVSLPIKENEPPGWTI